VDRGGRGHDRPDAPAARRRVCDLPEYEEVADAIRGMVIRGAPAIGVAAAMGCAGRAAHERRAVRSGDGDHLAAFSRDAPHGREPVLAIERMNGCTRPCAGSRPGEIRRRLVEEAQAVREGTSHQPRHRRNGALVPDHKTVLTHCNAGALATAGYGTALGVVRAAIESGQAGGRLRRRDPPVPARRAAHVWNCSTTRSRSR